MSAISRSPLAAWRQPDKPTWILLALVAGLIVIFLLLLNYVSAGTPGSFDRNLLLALRSPTDVADPLGPGWVEEMGRDFTALGGVPILTLVSLGVLVYLLMVHKRRAALFVFAATFGALLLSNGLKLLVERDRPDLVPHGARVYTASFPSAHAMQSATTYLTLGVLMASLQRRRRVQVYLVSGAVLVTLLVGVSRVYLGVHWPTDVLAGWAVGAAWALLCWLALRQLQRQGQIEQPARLPPEVEGS